MLHFSRSCKAKFQQNNETLYKALDDLRYMGNECAKERALKEVYVDAEKALKNQLEEQKAIVNYTLLEKEKLEKEVAKLKVACKKYERETKDLCAQIKNIKKNKPKDDKEFLSSFQDKVVIDIKPHKETS